MNKTLIKDVDSKNEEISYTYDPLIDSHQLRKNVIDLFLPIELRLQYIELYHSRETEQFGEIISCINGMYSFSRTVSLKQYIIAIAQNNSIPIIYRIDCSKNLNEEGYTFINDLCKDISFIFLPTPIRVETVIYLMKNAISYKEESIKYFCEIINDIHIESLYRFKLIQSLENTFPLNSDLFYFYANEATKFFIDSPYNNIIYRVICCQYIFQKCGIELHSIANNFLLEVASQPDINEDVRADACDILLAYGTPENIENARMILFVLGGGERARNNVFKNSQNVHNQAIEESVEKLIEFISLYTPRNGKYYTFDMSKEDLVEKIKNQDKYDHEILNQSIIRITIDRAIYGRFNLSLANIISKMWTYIQDSDYKDELEKRLLEELIDSNNKCSSGYVSRIVNTLSGFGEVSLQISFEDQIIAVLETRLNAKIIEDENSDLILDEITIPVRFYEKRRNFLSFFRKNISFIREDMYQEFKDYVNDQDYDLFFRKAIMHYEGLN